MASAANSTPSDYLPTPNEWEASEVAVRLPCLEFVSPKQLREYQPPKDAVLVGDFHITRGSVFVIGGAPGVGKSRASVALAVAGATGKDWFGLKVHRQFKTMIIQNENGMLRLSCEFTEIPEPNLDDWIRVSKPPAYGITFDQADFRAALRLALESFRPDMVIVDPWNAAAPDDNARNYLETFKSIRAVVGTKDDAPALGIVAHTRKPKNDERNSGRSLLNLLAGSYVLGSVPRAVFVIQPASQSTEDDRIIFTCCKNNDGTMEPPSAWRRRNGLFESVPDFDWKSLNTESEERAAITLDDLATLFENGRQHPLRKIAVTNLQEQTGCGQSAAYNALNLKGRFKDHLREDANGFLHFSSTGLHGNSTETDGMDSIPPNPQGDRRNGKVESAPPNPSTRVT